MKNNKLSPLEELKAEKMLLSQEIKLHESNLKTNMQFAKNNWGSLLVSSVFSPSTHSVKSLLGFDSVFSRRKTSWLDKLTMILPIAWGILQPVLLGLATKKVASLFTRKKKKKKK